MKRCNVMRLTIYILALLCIGPVPAAEKFPVKPIRMVVPFAPGGISDVLARTIAEKMTEALGQTVIIDNRGGAAGSIGTRIVARASADGYTLLFCAPAFATTPSLSSQAGYDPIKDFAPIAQVASATNLLVTVPATGVQSVQQLIDTARKRPGVLNYGSGGAGTSGQLAAELFQSAAGVKITHIAYKGAGPALTALLGNEVQLMFLPVVLAIPHLSSGRLVPLAVTGIERSRAVPNVPTIAEAAIPGFDVTSWFGVMAPAAIPHDRVVSLHTSIVRALHTQEVAERLMAQGAEPEIKSADEFGAYVKSEVVKWEKVIRGAGIKTK